MNSPDFNTVMFIVNIVIAVSTTATAVLVIIKMVSDRRAKLDKYERAVTEGYVYDSGVKTLADMCSRFILNSIMRHNDGTSCKYGFHKVVRDYNISNPKEFLKFVIDRQVKFDEQVTFDQLKYLLKLK